MNKGEMQGYILLVDDEPNIIRTIRTVLQAKGYTTDSAPDGKKALEKIRENRPRLVVSDIMMPELTGFEMLDIIRRDPALSDLPVVLLTAKPADFDGDGAKTLMRYYLSVSADRDRYLMKPFNPEKLANIVERLLSIAGSPTGTN